MFNTCCFYDKHTQLRVVYYIYKEILCSADPMGPKIIPRPNRLEL